MIKLVTRRKRNIEAKARYLGVFSIPRQQLSRCDFSTVTSIPDIELDALEDEYGVKVVSNKRLTESSEPESKRREREHWEGLINKLMGEARFGPLAVICEFLDIFILTEVGMVINSSFNTACKSSISQRCLSEEEVKKIFTERFPNEALMKVVLGFKLDENKEKRTIFFGICIEYCSRCGFDNSLRKILDDERFKELNLSKFNEILESACKHSTKKSVIVLATNERCTGKICKDVFRKMCDFNNYAMVVVLLENCFEKIKDFFIMDEYFFVNSISFNYSTKLFKLLSKQIPEDKQEEVLKNCFQSQRMIKVNILLKEKKMNEENLIHLFDTFSENNEKFVKACFQDCLEVCKVMLKTKKVDLNYGIGKACRMAALLNKLDIVKLIFNDKRFKRINVRERMYEISKSTGNEELKNFLNEQYDDDFIIEEGISEEEADNDKCETAEEKKEISDNKNSKE